MQKSQIEQFKVLEPVHEFLHCQTPDSWIEQAKRPENLAILLRDHANCELKASQTAMWLVRKYAADEKSAKALLDWAKPYEDFVYRKQFDNLNSLKKNELPTPTVTTEKDLAVANPLIKKMIRLIKEEFHHFEQVIAIMNERSIAYKHLSAGRYAKNLMSVVRTHEPATLVDKLIIGAYIEARSCERFAKLAPFLDEKLQNFYISLLNSEARHYQDYLQLASLVCSEKELKERIDFIGKKEASLIQAPDPEFRFHSGVPCIC
ncbi:MAG: tRNA isopentenyl-2-thiomethyl-A-37 hydroxylase MiaE [Enterovibrio sp.]